MGCIAKYRKRQLGILTAAIMTAVWMPTAMAAPAALPSGLHGERGVHIDDGKTNSTHMEIVVDGIDGKAKGIANWNDFSIAKNHSVHFGSELKDWMVLNRVTENNPSHIYGSLTGDGTIFLVNPHGITFHENASVDVGSLVASTRQISDDDFINNRFDFYTDKDTAGKNIDGKIYIKNGADVKAEDGYVALLAQEIHNSGTITAPDVALATGQKINLKYDDKIYLTVDESKDEGKSAIIATDKNYVLMRGSDVENIAGKSVINNYGTITATGLTKNDEGEVVLTAGDIVLTSAKVTLADNSKLSAAGGTITTSGYEHVTVAEKAEVHSVSADGKTAGNWNIVGKVLKVESTGGDNTINNVALSNSLADTNVNIIASPDTPAYYSDIHINEAITKNAEGENKPEVTSLTLTAGRNVCVDADITSTAGKLNVLLAGDSGKSLGVTNSDRGDGANIVRANIETNGGNFETARLHAKNKETGEVYLANGTYFGLRKTDALGTDKHVYTKGGDIKLDGAEVLLATGGTVVFDTRSGQEGVPDGKVTIVGTVNSANIYGDEKSDKDLSWNEANEAANNYDVDAERKPTGKSHLAVVTGALEDAIVSSTINDPEYKTNEGAYVGGHVVAVETVNGQVVDKNGNIIMNAKDIQDGDSVPNVAYEDDGVTVKTVANGETNVTGKNGGWYKLGDGSYVRFWAWTAGDEKGNIFFVQVNGKNVAGNNYELENLYDGKEHSQEAWARWEDKGHAVNGNYVNFAPGEPNDELWGNEKSQTALEVNHDTYYDAKRGNVLVSKWDDMPDGSPQARETMKTDMKNYVVETEIGKTSLHIKSGDALLNGKVGNLSKLNDLTIDSSGNVYLMGSVQAANKIALSAGKDVAIHDVLAADAKQAENAIDIRAQNNFFNEAKESVNALKAGEGSHWKIYANTPYAGKLGDLDSGNFAEWGWNGTDSTTATGSRYVFKYHPTLTFAADNVTKKYGEEISNTGYTVANELDGKFLGNFLDGYNVLFMNREGMKKGGTASLGYPATAPVGTYAIDLTDTGTAKVWGYNIVEKPGVLTIIEPPQTSDQMSTEKTPAAATTASGTIEDGMVLPEVKPQLDPLSTSNLTGTASYTTQTAQGPSADRVLGLQSAELPFFNEKRGTVKLYGTYDVTSTPDKVTMKPTAKVLPEPEQPKNQYREYEKEIATEDGSAKFLITYNGSTLDIYPTDEASKALLVTGDEKKNVALESQALYEAFSHMGITLDDLDGVYTHFEETRGRSFRS